MQGILELMGTPTDTWKWILGIVATVGAVSSGSLLNTGFNTKDYYRLDRLEQRVQGIEIKFAEFAVTRQSCGK